MRERFLTKGMMRGKAKREWGEDNEEVGKDIRWGVQGEKEG